MSRRQLIAAVALSSLAALAAARSASAGLVRFAAGLDGPVYLTAPPGDLDRVFVAELGGEVEILDVSTGERRPSPFLSLAFGTSVLGLAFHPDYASNGLFFVYTQDSLGCHLIRFSRAAGDPDLADADSAHAVLDLPETAGHVGGWVGFGPDAYL